MNKLNLLSLDGGGIRGISTLHILKQILESVDRDKPPKPCEYFDMIGGSGSGGVIALLLGRLRLGIDECIGVYRRLMEVFRRRESLFGLRRPKYSSKKLEQDLKVILLEIGYHEDMLLHDLDTSCRVLTCITDKTTRKAMLLTTYTNQRNPVRLLDALQANISHPSLFPSSHNALPLIPSEETTNPTHLLYTEAANIFPSLKTNLNCLISIGTGVPSTTTKPNSKSSKQNANHAMSINAEATAEGFIRQYTELDDENRYFRFSVPNGIAEIGLDKVDEMGCVVHATRDYMGRELVHKYFLRCADALRKREDTGDGDAILPSETFSPATVYPVFSQWINHEN
ncbi:hypothetical protein MW887_008860 [Aspergillus wentii]|nr:hypothetical protein MW887_008860 [Aspergillus wentii]